MPRYTLPQCRNRTAEIGEDGCEMFALDISEAADDCFAEGAWPGQNVLSNQANITGRSLLAMAFAPAGRT